MRCTTASKLISEHIDGNLAVKKERLLRRHLDTCLSCKRLLVDLKGIVDQAKEMKELSPSIEAWQETKAMLEKDKQKVLSVSAPKKSLFGTFFSPPRAKYALASILTLIIAAVLGTVALVNWWGDKDVKLRKSQAYALAKLGEAEQHYQLAIKALVQAASALEGEMDPQITEVFQKNMEIIDSSITACREKVLQQPDSIKARNYLLAAYMRKLDFMTEIVEVKKMSSDEKELKTTI